MHCTSIAVLRSELRPVCLCSGLRPILFQTPSFATIASFTTRAASMCLLSILAVRLLCLLLGFHLWCLCRCNQHMELHANMDQRDSNNTIRRLCSWGTQLRVLFCV